MSQNFSKDAFDNATEVQRQRCLLIGFAPPHASNSARHAARLMHMLRATGAEVQVLHVGPAPLSPSLPGFAYARELAASVQAVDDFGADRVFLYASALNFGSCEQSGWVRRRLEELRRLKFAFQIARNSSDLTTIFDPPSYRARTQLGVGLATLFGAFSRLGRPKFRLRTDRMAQCAKDGFDKDVPAPDPIVAERAFYAQSKTIVGRPVDARMTPTLALHALNLARTGAGNPSSVEFLNELHLLSTTVRDHPNEHLPLVRGLRRQSQQISSEISGPPVSHAYNVANRIALEGSQFALPLTQFMKHVHRALRLEDKFPLTSRSQVRDFLTWYREKGPSKSCGGALPEPLPVTRGLATGPLPDNTVISWGRLAHITSLDARPFPVPPEFLVSQDCLPNGRFDLETRPGRIAWAFEQILKAASAGSQPHSVGQAALDWFCQPIAERAGNITRFEYLMALECRRALVSGRDFLAPWQANTTQDWFQNFALARAPKLKQFASRTPVPLVRDHKIDLVGLGQKSTGIAVNFRMSQAAFAQAGLAFDIRDAEASYRLIHPQSAALPKKPLIKPQQSAALFHLNADRIPQALVAPAISSRRELYNIGFLLWEFAQLPKAHELALDMLDEIWVPTQFLKKTYAQATEKPVVIVGKGLQLPDVPASPLSQFGLSNAGTNFLTCFDFHSSVERKNPLAAVQAFQNAFPSCQEDVQLIIKTTPKLDGHWGDPEDQLGKIRKIARHDRRIKILSTYMQHEDFLSLIRSVDCLISPHRAEGFGYIPAYALYYGVPVVNTDYSGVTDYCTPKTALPVSYDLVDVAPHHGIFPMQGAKWADVHIEVLAEALLNIAEQPGAAKARAVVGRDLIHRVYSVPALGARYQARLAEIGVIQASDLKFCT